MQKAAIRHISIHLPENVLTNEQLAREFGETWTPEKILEKTGISTRHIAGADECASDLGVKAGKKLFRETGMTPADFDFLLFCTQSPDYFLPATCSLVHERLGLRENCGAIDFNQGCSGYIYGLSIAKGLVESGVAKEVLLITAETYSKHINPRDRSVRTIFGDGASATWIGSVPSNEDLIGPFVLGTDGKGAKNLIVPAGGLRHPLSREHCKEEEDRGGNWRSAANLYMNGPEIFNFTLESVPRTYRALLDIAQASASDIDFFVFHQANAFILERLRSFLNIEKAKFPYHMAHCGNTVSSSIPIVLAHLLKTNQLKDGMKAMLMGFGVGYSWGGALVKFSSVCGGV
jgi:3-oxoacyl-[acyl-carrier-protein] synthase-3